MGFLGDRCRARTMGNMAGDQGDEFLLNLPQRCMAPSGCPGAGMGGGEVGGSSPLPYTKDFFLLLNSH